MSKKKLGKAKAVTTKAQATAFEKAAQAASLVVKVGKGAVENRYRASIEAKDARTKFTGSVDMDAEFNASEPTSNRWDYGLGLATQNGKEFAVWVEPHSASSTGEVTTMLAKLAWLKAKLRLPAFKGLQSLTDECVRQGLQPYHWMATAHVGIRPGSPQANLLASRGLRPPCARIVI